MRIWRKRGCAPNVLQVLVPIVADLYREIRFFQDVLGASKVVVWNSVKRQSGAAYNELATTDDVQDTMKSLVPAARLTEVGGHAHVDQDNTNGFRICALAAGEEGVEKYARCQIINAWRPLVGAPLFSAFPFLWISR